jgi:hypothetical protein
LGWLMALVTQFLCHFQVLLAILKVINSCAIFRSCWRFWRLLIPVPFSGLAGDFEGYVNNVQ